MNHVIDMESRRQKSGIYVTFFFNSIPITTNANITDSDTNSNTHIK